MSYSSTTEILTNIYFCWSFYSWNGEKKNYQTNLTKFVFNVALNWRHLEEGQILK